MALGHAHNPGFAPPSRPSTSTGVHLRPGPLAVGLAARGHGIEHLPTCPLSYRTASAPPCWVAEIRCEERLIGQPPNERGAGSSSAAADLQTPVGGWTLARHWMCVKSAGLSRTGRVVARRTPRSTGEVIREATSRQTLGHEDRARMRLGLQLAERDSSTCGGDEQLVEL